MRAHLAWLVLSSAGAAAILPPSAPPAAAAPRLEVQAWDEALLPPTFGAGDSLPPRAYPPDVRDDTGRDALAARRAGRAPVLDGDLGEWRLVRWNDIGGARSRLRGRWDGDADLSLRFALQWDDTGLWLAATLRDDDLAPGDAPHAALEHVTLSLASRSPVVQRWWLAGSRSLRVRADGAVDGWTDLRNRRREAFDAAALGVRAAIRRQDTASGAAPAIDLEMCVPWAALYPLIPYVDAQPLCNVLADDVEEGEAETVAWSTQPTRRGELGPRWARLDLAGAAGGDAAVVHVVDSGPCSETLHEWLVVPTPRARREMRVRIRAGDDERTLRAKPPSRPYFLRLRDVPPARGWTAGERALEVEIDSGDAPPSVHRLRRPPDVAALRAARADLPLASSAPQAPFPQAADIAVRLERAAAAVEALGVWVDRRYHTTGIVAHRMAAWAALEPWLEQAEVLDDFRRGAAGAPARLAALWPQRAPSGLPLGSVVLRGYVSEPDRSVQPYALFAPADHPIPAPLVVALHGIDAGETALFAATTLATQCARRGFVAVCPYGRGNTGFRLAGERDVLDVLAAVRGALPIDAARLYATGPGLGGTGTWTLALRHPGLLAAAAPVSGYGDLDQNDFFTRLGYQQPERDWFNAHNPVRLVRDDLRTAFLIVHGERDAAISPVHARIMAARLAEAKVPHELRIDPAGGHGIAFFDSELAAVCEFFAGQVRPGGGVVANVLGGRGGPVCDVFARGPFAIVYGTQGAAAADDSATAAELAAEWRRRFAGDAVVRADTAIDPAAAAAWNLLLVGTPESNRWLAQWAAALPVRYDSRRAIVNGTPYGLAEHGVVWAAPSPADPARAIVVCSGMRGRVLGVERSVFMLGSDCMIAGPGLTDVRVERLGASP
jgi:dienelactone hydrolase